jgi:hypothetical protein
MNSATGYPIDSTVVASTSRMISFQITMPTDPPHAGVVPTHPNSPNCGTNLNWAQLDQISDYDKLGYVAWTFGAPLPIVQRFDIMQDTGDYSTTAASLTRLQQFANFFTIIDIHITNTDAPSLLIQLQQTKTGFSGNNTSIYSPVMMYTTHFLNSAISTANALLKKHFFDFAISPGDTCSSIFDSKLSWYTYVIDCKVITPSSGAHLGAGTFACQKPNKAAGLCKLSPSYQYLTNHDHLMVSSFPDYADPSLGPSDAFICDAVWAVTNCLPTPNNATFPPCSTWQI